jgi:GAF domain-containing protein
MVDQFSAVVPFATLSNNVLRLEQLLHQPQAENGAGPEAIALLRELRRNVDQINFLYDTSRRLTQNLPLRDVLTLLMDTLWRRQYSFVVILLGETELGPYTYHEMRGVVDPLRFLGKQCPLPLWGELAHALVRRLDPDEPDYVIISDLANSSRPRPQEFPWLEREGSLMIVPLRKDHIAMGALILGRPSVDGFSDSESCAELGEIAAAAAMALYNAQVRHELQARADQLVGLQLFTRSLPISGSLFNLLVATAMGIADLLVNTEVFLVLLRKHCLALPVMPPPIYMINLPWNDLCIVGSRAQPSADLLHTALYRLIMWTIEAGQALFFNPLQEYSAPEDLYYNEAGQAMLVPLSSGDEALGVIYAVSRDPERHFDENDMVVTRTMANVAAALIKLNLADGKRG